MQNVRWPAAAKTYDISFSVLGHSIGGQGAGGDYAFARGAGAYWRGKFSVAAMAQDDACDTRGFVHSLRGQNGSFLWRVPSAKVAGAAAWQDLYWGADALLWGGEQLTWQTSDGYEIGAVLSANVAKNGICLSLDGVPAQYVIAEGVMLRVGGAFDSAQLVEVVAVDGGDIEFRPPMRSDFPAGTPVAAGRVFARFRIEGDVPYIPLNGQYSSPFQFQFCEYY